MKEAQVNKIQDIAINIFEVTCYMFPLEEWEIEEAEDFEKPDGSVRSVVHFEGAAKGGMVISPSGHLLNAIAANMLGVEAASDEDKEGALCEIANIICGNTVPMFAVDNDICYIRPPRIAKSDENTDELFQGMRSDKLQILLDEGIADITIYYS
ncbi:MAG: chemotaxis protein CheX [Gracilimonas sp.]